MPMSDETQKRIPRVLIPAEKIQARIIELGQEISQDYKGQTLTVLCILKGSFVFFSDLVRALELETTCEFLGVSSYGSKMVSSGEVKITLDLNEPLEGKHLLIVEDIVDTGLTLNFISAALKARKPASVKTCSLLIKPECLKTEVKVDYIGFRIGNEFVVGYGIDYASKFRNLPFVGSLEHDH